MKKSVLALTALVGAAMTASAMAHPRPAPGTKARATPGARSTFLMGPDGPGINDTFDTYANGSGIIGQGGWQGWSGTVPAPEGYVSNAQKCSPANSLRLRVGVVGVSSNTDAVQVHAITGGKWVYSAKTFAPSTSTGNAYFILLNSYPAFVWSLDLGLNMDTNLVSTIEAGTTPLPLVEDQWVDVRVNIDLDAMTQEIFYGCQSMGTIPWGTPAVNTLQALDLYSESTDEFYYDNVKLESVTAFSACTVTPCPSPCYADCNGSGTLTVQDFGCFQTKFVANDPYADCNNSGTLTVQDFGCFQTKFVSNDPYADCNASGTLTVQDFGCFQTAFVAGCP